MTGSYTSVSPRAPGVLSEMAQGPIYRRGTRGDARPDVGEQPGPRRRRRLNVGRCPSACPALRQPLPAAASPVT